jgi:DNA-binding GntR family transcriptional regulator
VVVASGSNGTADESTRTVPVYLEIAEYLRGELAELQGGKPGRLPTESELTQRFGVSRYSARKAYAELVAQGLVERTAGKGTFPLRSRAFQMSVDTVHDLLARQDDRELEILTPLTPVGNATAATKLGLPSDEVSYVEYRLRRDGEPFALTRIYLPPHVAAVLSDVPFLHKRGAVGKEAVVSILDRKLPHPIALAKQVITAVAASADLAELLDYVVGEPLLEIEYLYFDADARPVQLAENYYHPGRYEYRAKLEGRQA